MCDFTEINPLADIIIVVRLRVTSVEPPRILVGSNPNY